MDFTGIAEICFKQNANLELNLTDTVLPARRVAPLAVGAYRTWHYAIFCPCQCNPKTYQMAAIDELLDHYRKLRTQMLDDIASFESGRMSMGEIQNGERVDITDKWVQELRRRIDDLDGIITYCERRNV